MLPPTSRPDAIASGIRKRLKDFLDWKAVLFGCAALGAVATTVTFSVATKADVSQAVTPLRVDVDRNMRRLDALDEGNRWRDATLKAIADKLGVFAPPPPPQP